MLNLTNIQRAANKNNSDKVYHQEMGKIFKSGHLPNLVVAELPFIGGFIHLYSNLYELTFSFSNSPCRTLYNRDQNKLAKAINYNDGNSEKKKKRNHLNTHQ